MAMSETGRHLRYVPTQESRLYPETDGQPMAASDDHRRVLMRILRVLEAFFKDIPEVYVSGDLLMYYVQGDPRKAVAPGCARLFWDRSKGTSDVSRLAGGEAT